MLILFVREKSDELFHLRVFLIHPDGDNTDGYPVGAFKGASNLPQQPISRVLQEFSLQRQYLVTDILQQIGPIGLNISCPPKKLRLVIVGPPLQKILANLLLGDYGIRS